MQWQAFCERAKLDALDGTSEEAEAILANFHFQLEDGASRFEADAGEGWPPGAHHPVQVRVLEHPSAPVPPQLLGAFQPAPPPPVQFRRPGSAGRRFGRPSLPLLLGLLLTARRRG